MHPPDEQGSLGTYTPPALLVGGGLLGVELNFSSTSGLLVHTPVTRGSPPEVSSYANRYPEGSGGYRWGPSSIYCNPVQYIPELGVEKKIGGMSIEFY